MASIIDNRSKTMLDSLKNSLKQAESVDILTAFFYFSGFNALAEDLKDKKIRILVGCTIDPNAIGELCNAVKNNPDEELSSYSIRGYLEEKHIKKIADAYNGYESILGFASKATIQDVADNNYSLSIPLYVKSTGEENKIDNRTLQERYDGWRASSDVMKLSYEKLNRLLKKEDTSNE